MRAEHVRTWFPVRKGILKRRQFVKAVDDVSFSIHAGETFGLVGESGCGKSTLGRSIVQIYKPTDGRILFKGKDIARLNSDEQRTFHKECQLIFQDPYASLDPRMTVGEIIMEPMVIHGLYGSHEERESECARLLQDVGLKPDHIRRYPHEFSGGQRQRVSIARTLALKPDFIVCDEPISALDVSIQAQIINLLKEVQERLGIAYLFIAHDISVVDHISDRIGVMYLGHLVEVGGSHEVCREPMHPYTQALLSAVPLPDPVRAKSSRRQILDGELPSPLDPPAGCPFHTRCPRAMEVCRRSMPRMRSYGDRQCACHALDGGTDEA